MEFRVKMSLTSPLLLEASTMASRIRKPARQNLSATANAQTARTTVPACLQLPLCQHQQNRRRRRPRRRPSRSPHRPAPACPLRLRSQLMISAPYASRCRLPAAHRRPRRMSRQLTRRHHVFKARRRAARRRRPVSRVRTSWFPRPRKAALPRARPRAMATAREPRSRVSVLTRPPIGRPSRRRRSRRATASARRRRRRRLLRRRRRRPRPHT